MSHLLVTNDFPPKLGGIQTYLYELWRRLPAEETTVMTTAHPHSFDFDSVQQLRIVRTPHRVLLPTPKLRGQVIDTARATESRLVVLDPLMPLGLIGPQLRCRYGVVLHGAEVRIPGRLPLTSAMAARVLRSANVLVAAGDYAAEQAVQAAPSGGLNLVVIPPGVDVERFRPLSGEARQSARRRLGFKEEEVVLLSISRLVPRKGIDVVIRAVGRLQPRSTPDAPLVLAIAGAGRDRPRLEAVARAARVRVRWLGHLSPNDLPLAYASADVFAMCCRDRWFGLEQEGFGIVFLEAAACGLPQVAGRSGGSHEAVADGVTGVVVERPKDDGRVAEALEPLLVDQSLREKMGAAARQRVEQMFSYELLAESLAKALREAGE